MPPNAETGSVSSARRYASTSSSAEARPTGSMCLAMTTVGAVKSAAIRYAASRSSRLLNVGGAPWSWVASARDPRAVRRLAVERRVLVRVLAVGQVARPSRGRASAVREHVPADLVEIRGDLRVVCGDRRERLGGEPQRVSAETRPASASRRRPGRNAPGSQTAATPAAFRAAAPRSAAPPTSIISIASSMPRPRPTSGANGATLTTTRSMSPMPCAVELVELLGHVAAREDARRRSPGGTS